MWWNSILLSLTLLPGSYALDPLLTPHNSNNTSSNHRLQSRDGDECIPGTLSGSRYCPTCDGIDVPTPHMFIKCQDISEKSRDDEVHAYEETNGNCRVYHLQWPEASIDQEQPKCTRYCQGLDGADEDATAACVGFTLETGNPMFDDNFFYSLRDSEGRYYEMAECQCDMELAAIVLDIVLESIAEAMKEIAPILFIACKLFAAAIELAADAAISALPGGGALTAARRAATTTVKAAKTTYQNGGSEKTFKDLSSAMCPQANFGHLDFGKGFNNLLGVSDEYASGDGCKDKKRSLRGRAKGKGGKNDDKERVECRDLPESSKDQPPKDDKDNGMDGAEEKARKENDEKNQPKESSKPPASTPSPSATRDPPDSTTPASSNTPTPTDAGCDLCSSPKPKLARRDGESSGYGLMYARAAPGKDKDDTSGGDVCIRKDRPLIEEDLGDDLAELTISDEKCEEEGGIIPRSLDFSSLLGIAGLEKRVVSTKTGKIKWNNGQTHTLVFGRYDTCGTAKGMPEIDQYYKVHHDPNFCSVAVKKVGKTKGTRNGVQYQTEHVYEAQTLKRFLAWLAKGGRVKAGSAHTRPTEKWVQEVLVGLNNPFMLISEDVLGTPKAGDNVFAAMTYGFGRSDGPFGSARGLKELTLAHDVINAPKGVLFQANNLVPKLKGKNLEESRAWVRRGPVVFGYLGFKGTDKGDDPVWNKWMRVSNWIDLVCHVFDEEYTWGSRAADEPKVPGGTRPSLRALYAYWIDQELAGIETKMEKWSTTIEKNFDAAFKNPKGADKGWRDKAFDANGFAKADKLKFPRLSAPQPRNGASQYGAYGIADYTKNKDDQVTDVGVPDAIS